MSVVAYEVTDMLDHMEALRLESIFGLCQMSATMWCCQIPGTRGIV